MAENTNVESIEFRPADGGAISKTRLMDKPSRDGMIAYRHPKEAVHPTLEHAAAHLKKHMKMAFGKSAGKGKGIEVLQKESTKKIGKTSGGMKKG